MRVQSRGGKESFIFEGQISPSLEYRCESLRFTAKRPAQFPVISCSISGSTDLLEIIFRRFRKIAKSDCYLIMSVCPSVRPFAWKNSAPTEGIFMKFDI